MQYSTEYLLKNKSNINNSEKCNQNVYIEAYHYMYFLCIVVFLVSFKNKILV